MTSPRSPGPPPTVAGCSLLDGAPECRCLSEAPHLSDQQLLARSTAMFRWQQRAGPTGRAAARLGLDRLLVHTRSRGTSTLVSELLRMSIMIRIFGTDLADAGEVEALLDEFTQLAELDGDSRRRGEAATLRAHRTTVFGRGDDALADAAAAHAILTDITEPGPDEDPAEWSRLLSRSLNGLVIVLLKLGAHEVADEVSQRAITVAESGGTVMDRLIHQLNRVRLQLSWALRLERGGREAAAATRFVGAAQAAHAAGTLWGPARGRYGDGRPAAQECSIIGSAYALRSPGPEHLVVLEGLVEVVRFPDDRIVLAIATARCLLADGRPARAVAVLAPLRDELGAGPGSDAVLTLALHREFAQADAAARADPALPPPPTVPPHGDGLGSAASVPASHSALRRYAAALETELWALREARLTALRSHSDHHRLTREHGFVTAQALQDPLTGLPNRRALDLRLTEATTAEASQPCAIALIDLDHFKDVNDARSHAAGDIVLREVAGRLRTALRAQDMVARYGGDEFVVVMPATSLPVAKAALRRAAEAVAELPTDVGAGVTMSVGVVRAPVDGDPGVALAAADAAMYRAKHAGGNTVVSGTTPPGPNASWDPPNPDPADTSPADTTPGDLPNPVPAPPSGSGTIRPYPAPAAWPSIVPAARPPTAATVSAD